jgi:thiamine pyrophosphokinase
MSRCIIFANGTLPDIHSARELIRADDLILAADGGTRHALDLGLRPSVIIGDLDSATFDLKPLTEAGTRIIRYPRDKNKTDLELALEHVIEHGQREVIILAALGARLDQTLGNLSLLTNPQYATLDIRLDDGVEEAFFVRDQGLIRGHSGDLVSLLPWGGEVPGIRTEGLRWPLSNETLFPCKTRGISNEMTGGTASIKTGSGLLLVIHRRQSKSADRK